MVSRRLQRAGQGGQRWRGGQRGQRRRGGKRGQRRRGGQGGQRRRGGKRGQRRRGGQGGQRWRGGGGRGRWRSCWCWRVCLACGERGAELDSVSTAANLRELSTTPASTVTIVRINEHSRINSHKIITNLWINLRRICAINVLTTVTPWEAYDEGEAFRLGLRGHVVCCSGR